MGFKDTWNQVVYAFSSENRYADYDANNAAQGNPASAISNGNNNNGPIQLSDATNFTEDGVQHSTEGVSETILAWRHIETWTSENHEDLNASLADPCTRTDISKAEEDLGLELPAPVRASLRIHDGQEDLGSLTDTGGLIFGLQLMSIDLVVEMTKTWRNVADRVNRQIELEQQQNSLLSGANSSKSRSNVSLVETKPGYSKADDSYEDPDLQDKISHTPNPKKFKSNIPRQRSMPPGHIQPVYAHPNWIPLVTDKSGNHIGVDLAPDSKGKWGQVICFGRDFDMKFVLASNWGDFLLMFAKDLENGNYALYQKVEDVFGGEGDLVYQDKVTGREIPYLRVLTDRVFAKFRSENHPHQQSHSHSQQQRVASPPLINKDLSRVGKKSTSTERIVSTDITQKDEVNSSTNNDDNDDDEDKKKGTIEVSTKETTEDDDEEDPDASQDIGDKTLVNDFKEVSI